MRLLFFHRAANTRKKQFHSRYRLRKLFREKWTFLNSHSQKAFAYLRAQTDFGPRNPNSLGHQKCLEYVAAELSHYAEKVTRENFTHQGYGGEILKLTNIFGSFNATASDRILLLAHWDTRPRADEEKDPAKQNQPILGANDGVSGVAVLLEIARLLKQVSPPIGVDILFVTEKITEKATTSTAIFWDPDIL